MARNLQPQNICNESINEIHKLSRCPQNWGWQLHLIWFQRTTKKECTGKDIEILICCSNMPTSETKTQYKTPACYSKLFYRGCHWGLKMWTVQRMMWTREIPAENKHTQSFGAFLTRHFITAESQNQHLNFCTKRVFNCILLFITLL